MFFTEDIVQDKEINYTKALTEKKNSGIYPKSVAHRLNLVVQSIYTLHFHTHLKR